MRAADRCWRDEPSADARSDDAGCSGVSEGVDGIDPERRSRGLDAGKESRAQHHRGCYADPRGERHEVLGRPVGPPTPATASSTTPAPAATQYTTKHMAEAQLLARTSPRVT